MNFENLKDCVIIDIEGQVNDEELKLTLSDFSTVTMYHNQDCCESVYLEDICGDLGDLIGSKILVATVSSSHAPIEESDTYLDESFTWTFYTLRTQKGTVTFRWYGGSNGYYSEDVSCHVTPAL